MLKPRPVLAGAIRDLSARRARPIAATGNLISAGDGAPVPLSATDAICTEVLALMARLGTPEALAALPADASPLTVWAMEAVRVWIEVKKFQVILGLLPAAMVTAMVSPTAREKARITEVAMPDRAAGTTTRRLTWRLEEPRP